MHSIHVFNCIYIYMYTRVYVDNPLLNTICMYYSKTIYRTIVNLG